MKELHPPGKLPTGSQESYYIHVFEIGGTIMEVRLHDPVMVWKNCRALARLCMRRSHSNAAAPMSYVSTITR